MANDVTLAFDHPEARSRATPPERHAPRDRISVRDHIVEVEIGAFQQERGQTQRISFNVVVEVPAHDTATGDDVDRILSYDAITDAISAALAEERLNLLETLAERVAERILTEPLALRCFVRIEKLDRGPGKLGVEIMRDPPQSRDALPPAPQPLVVILPNAALASPHLPRWLDQIAARGWAILCVGPADLPVPAADDAEAQRRIDLLAIEQNAWALAARDARLSVVGSRTELDWALRHDQLSVWAPSKLVLDSVDRPPVGPRDGAALATWLASQMNARGILAIGAELPQTDRPATRIGLDDETLP